MQAVLLKPGKEESPVLSQRSTQGESINIVAEDGLWDGREPVEVGNRIKTLGLVAPEQSAMKLVSAGLRDDIKDSPAGPPEFSAEVAGLDRYLLDGIRNGKYLVFAGSIGRIVFGSIEHVIVPTRSLAVNREASSGTRHVAPDLTARGLGHAGQYS